MMAKLNTDSKYNVVVNNINNGKVALYTDKPITFKELGYYLSTLRYTTIDTTEFCTTVFELTPDGNEILCTGTVQGNIEWQFDEEVRQCKKFGQPSISGEQFVLLVRDKRLDVDVYKMMDDLHAVYQSLEFYEKNILHPNYEFIMLHDGHDIGTGSLDECIRHCKQILGLSGEPLVLNPNEVDWKGLYISTELSRIENLIKQGDIDLGMKLVRDLVQKIQK